METFLIKIVNIIYGLNRGHKKVKRELTEEEIAKKTEQARLRKLHAKKLIEDEKREAVERILNEDGRKLRERQKKQNEEMKKKSKMEEEKMKKNLTKIITKYTKDGKIYVRFPQGFLLPSVFNQTKKEIKPIPKCYIEGCNNLKKYTDPKTGLPYCSVNCFKILRSQFQTKEISIKI
jgi:INO80 complex subunit B